VSAPRIAFSTLAFPDASLATAISVEWEKRWHPEIEEPEVALPQHLSVLNTWLAELEARA
jgi:hypothetical protein